MKINLYKIDLPTIDKLIEELTKKNYNLLESKNTKDSTFYLFLNSKIRKTKNWIEELSHVFDELNKNEFDFGNIYNAILIIEFDNNFFGIPFGYAFHILREICDPEFAMNFAESQLDNSNIELKGSFFVQSTKIKELVSYRTSNRIRYDPGESFYFVSGKPKDSYFGNKIKCGFSIDFSKEFVLENMNSLEEISKFVKKVDSALKSSKEFNFPRICRYKKSDPITEYLDNKVLEVLKKSNFKNENIEVVIDILPVFLKYGISIFNDKGRIKYNKHEKEYDEITIENICDFLKENNVKDLNNVKIILEEQEIEKDEIKLKDILLVHFEDNGEKYVLNEGFWGKYNDSFLNLLEKKLNEISKENMKLNKFEIDNFSNEDEYINKIVSKIPNSIKLHKVFVDFSHDNVKAKRIEIADLYKDGELITIKLGKDNSDFCYAFDQAYQGVICLTQNNDTQLHKQLKNEIDESKIEEILNSKTYAILFGFEQKTYLEQIKNKTFNLNNLGSFILKLKIVWWDDFMGASDLNYKIYVEGVKKKS